MLFMPLGYYFLITDITFLQPRPITRILECLRESDNGPSQSIIKIFTDGRVSLQVDTSSVFFCSDEYFSQSAGRNKVTFSWQYCRRT